MNESNLNENREQKRSFMRPSMANNEGVADDTAIADPMSYSNMDRVEEEENFSLAIVGGLLASFVCIVIWAAITVITKYQITYMAVGVGFAVGYSIQKFGKGRTLKFAFLGAILSLLTCVLGNLFSVVCLVANEYGDYTYFQAFSELDLETSYSVLLNSFQFTDLFFYAAALYCGFMFSRKSD